MWDQDRVDSQKDLMSAWKVCEQAAASGRSFLLASTLQVRIFLRSTLPSGGEYIARYSSCLTKFFARFRTGFGMEARFTSCYPAIGQLDYHFSARAPTYGPRCTVVNEHPSDFHLAVPAGWTKSGPGP